MKIIFSNLKEYEKQFNIKFEKPKISKHSNGFISVRLDWGDAGSDDFFNFKHVSLAHNSSGGFLFQTNNSKRKRYNIITASFEFPTIKESIWKKLNKTKDTFVSPWFSISITTSLKNAFKEGYEYDFVFFRNTKFGLICWFAPKGWEDWDNTEAFKG